MYMDDIKLFAKRKRIGNLNTDSENIRSSHNDWIWYKKCTMLIMKSGKRYMTDGMEQPNQNKIRTIGEKET